MENLDIYSKLKSVPQEACKEITGGRLRGMTDIKPQWRIEKMTEIFGPCGFGWKYEIVNINYSNPDSMGQVSCSVKINLYYNLSDIWSQPIPGIGGSMFITQEKNGLYMSDEAEKMALTDALSVAMKAIGMGADIYMGKKAINGGSKYDLHEGPTPTPLKEDWKIVNEAKEKVKKAGTMADLQEIWNNYRGLHTNELFILATNNRKKELATSKK